MAFALVKWIIEDRVSVIPSAWIIEPNPTSLNSSILPVDGVCFWKKKTSKHSTIILALSDTKKILERQLLSASKDEQSKDEQPPPKKKVRDEQTTTLKTRKENKEIEKARKLAKVASANKMAREILNASAPVPHASASHASDPQKKYKEKIAALQEELEDASSSLEAKRALISNLQTQLRELESENILLKQNLETTPSTLVSRDFPRASREGFRLLQDLLHYYQAKPLDSTPLDGSMESSIVQDKSIQLEPARVTVQAASPTTIQNPPSMHTNSAVGIKTIKCGHFSYEVTSKDLQLEQEAFQAGEGKRELVKDFGVYIKYIELENIEQSAKCSPTGLMRSLVSLWYGNPRLAASSACSINANIRTAVFKYCELKYPGRITSEKLKRDLTSKCGEERRKQMKK